LKLWNAIMKPVLIGCLKLKPSPTRPRVWLCPSGPFCFLPLHAAGVPGNINLCVQQFAIISYIPTVGTLIQARNRYQKNPLQELKFLLLAQPFAPGHDPLGSVIQEVISTEAAIKKYSQDAIIYLTDQGLDSQGGKTTIENVTKVLEQVHGPSVLHIACHGKQIQDAPLESGFEMLDGRLKVENLMKLKLNQAFLAFLSACETAAGDFDQPDEIIHLAATMLYIGFKSVIGTMWPMPDTFGPVVAQAIYQKLLEAKKITPDIIPRALEGAIKRFKNQNEPSYKWAPFIHIGI